MNTVQAGSVPKSIVIEPVSQISQLTNKLTDSSSSTAIDISPEPTGFTLYQPSQPEENVIQPTVRIQGAKLVVPSFLLALETEKQSKNGIMIMIKILETVERLGYDKCLGNKKKGHFIRSLNNVMHAQDGPLHEFKKVKDTSFQKKVSLALKVLDSTLSMSHSDRDGADGEDWPSHLVGVLTLYKRVKETSTIEPSKPTASSENLAIQKLVFDQQPSELNVIGAPRTSVRAENAQLGHDLVTRGDNTHDASGKQIMSTTPSSVENRKKINVNDLKKASSHSKEGFDAFLSTFADNASKREERIISHTKRKLELAERKVEVKERKSRLSF